MTIKNIAMSQNKILKKDLMMKKLRSAYDSFMDKYSVSSQEREELEKRGFIIKEIFTYFDFLKGFLRII